MIIPKNDPTLRSMDLSANVSVNSTGSGQISLKKPSTNTTRLSTDMRPINYKTLLGFLDTLSPPTLFPGWCLNASRSMKTIRRVVAAFPSRLYARDDGRNGPENACREAQGP